MQFDSVIMLTWSNWHTEPRSNRYHYAVRFAERWPVYFVQPDSKTTEVSFEPLEDIDITIVHVPGHYGTKQADAMRRAFAVRGIQRPLLWIYNPNFEEFIQAAPAQLRIFHATEDYFIHSEIMARIEAVVKRLIRVLGMVDILVGVSERVLNNYVKNGDFKSRAMLLRNGCDFRFWDKSNAADYRRPPNDKRVVFYQGAINSRVDISLLDALTDFLPDWEFWFCGDVKCVEFEKIVANKPNVKVFGRIDLQGIADLARQSLVGIIPFRQTELIQVSLPLKAYEYIACGLPVISVPIDELASRPDLFKIETTAEGFRIRYCSG